MDIEELQKTIAEHRKQIEKAEEELKLVPGDLKIRQEKILQLVKEELKSLENELSKYK